MNGRANASASSASARQRQASRRRSSSSTLRRRFFIVLTRNSQAPQLMRRTFLRVRIWMMIGIATAASPPSMSMLKNCMD